MFLISEHFLFLCIVMCYASVKRLVGHRKQSLEGGRSRGVSKQLVKAPVEYFLLPTRLFFVTFQNSSRNSWLFCLFEENTCSRLCQPRSLTMSGAAVAAAADDDDCDDKVFLFPSRSIDRSIYLSIYTYIFVHIFFCFVLLL